MSKLLYLISIFLSFLAMVSLVLEYSNNGEDFVLIHSISFLSATLSFMYGFIMIGINSSKESK